MPELRGLTGTTKPLACVYATTPTGAIRLIARNRAVTASGDSGALNIWRDDRRQLRSNFCRYRSTLDEAVHPTTASLRAWLKIWWPRLVAEGSK